MKVFGGVRVAHLFSFLCCLINYLSLCSEFRVVMSASRRYDFRIKTMFGSSLPPVVCRRVHVLSALFVYGGLYLQLFVGGFMS